MERVALIGGCRTPFVKAGGPFSEFSFLSLGTHVVEALLRRLDLDPVLVDELAFGTVLLDPRAPNFAREIVLRSALPSSLPAHSVSSNCITGLVAASMIGDGIASGRISCGIAGGAESMSRPTLTLREEAERFFLALARAKTGGERARALARFRPKFLFPIPPSPKEPSTGLTMGEHCEITAKEFHVPRETQDRIAFESHRRAAESGAFHALQIEPFHGIGKDALVRPDTTLERLSRLPPVFDGSGAGTITAGNSSALTDGAAAVCLLSEREAKRQGREPLAFIEAIEFAALPPAEGLLMAPALAVPRLLERRKLSLDDIDLFEIHEAFGAQVAANLEAWKAGWGRRPEVKPIGEIPPEKMNVRGGSIALGHPFAATGGRLMTGLALMMKEKGLKRGLISVCAAGGMAAAMLLHRE